MTQATAARTPGAKRASPGEHLFELESLARIDRIEGGPVSSQAGGDQSLVIGIRPVL